MAAKALLSNPISNLFVSPKDERENSESKLTLLLPRRPPLVSETGFSSNPADRADALCSVIYLHGARKAHKTFAEMTGDE
jgi:hypothetical protein